MGRAAGPGAVAYDASTCRSHPLANRVVATVSTSSHEDIYRSTIYGSFAILLGEAESDVDISLECETNAETCEVFDIVADHLTQTIDGEVSQKLPAIRAGRKMHGLSMKTDKYTEMNLPPSCNAFVRDIACL